jgi:hypothetical protein
MNKTLLVVLAVSIIGNLIGLFIAYKLINTREWLRQSETSLSESQSSAAGLSEAVSAMTAKLDETALTRMIFMHHSVGRGLLERGKLREQLLNRGILVKGATFGDELGEDTDMNFWLEKFRTHMPQILSFKAHPNQYRTDTVANDIVMFKSCFPNSDVVADGDAPGDPNVPVRTIANYKALFGELKREFAKYPNTLFIYLTSPPLVPELTTTVNAKRAHAFNSWVVNEFVPAYKQETGLSNFAAFDLHAVLADSDNVLKAEYRQNIEGDSHPNTMASRAAVEAFLRVFDQIWDSWRKQR